MRINLCILSWNHPSQQCHHPLPIIYESSGKFLEYSSHQLLECGGCIAISHLHYLALKCAKYCRECCFADILWSYACLLISFSHIQFGSEPSSCYIMTDCILIRERCHRLNMVCSIPLFFSMHSIGIACFAAPGAHHPAVV